jgi:hypothetical protein
VRTLILTKMVGDKPRGQGVACGVRSVGRYDTIEMR